jgi:hypothetical protein
MPVKNGPLFVWLLETVYGDSLNSAPFTFEGETIPKWHARFEGAESSDEIETNGVTYNIITWRIELAQPGTVIESGFVRQIHESGSYFVNTDGAKEVLEDVNGIPVVERIPLDKNGNIATNVSEQAVTEWVHHRLVDYTDILSGA